MARIDVLFEEYKFYFDFEFSLEVFVKFLGVYCNIVFKVFSSWGEFFWGLVNWYWVEEFIWFV